VAFGIPGIGNRAPIWRKRRKVFDARQRGDLGKRHVRWESLPSRRKLLEGVYSEHVQEGNYHDRGYSREHKPAAGPQPPQYRHGTANSTGFRIAFETLQISI